LGCGTGLAGPLFRPYSASLTGVDLSGRMLEKAAKRQVYDQLLEAELTEFLANTTQTFDIIIAADTLVYFGDLGDFFAAARRVLAPGGTLAFTLEKADTADDGEPYFLRLHGRYSHRVNYVRTALHDQGLAPGRINDITPRKEAGVPVQGILVLATADNSGT